jgi:hypothetical protein
MVGVGLEDNQRGGPIWNASLFDVTSSTTSDYWGLLIGSVIFGAIHLAVWNFMFPTSIERTIWRIASILCTSGLCVLYGCDIILSALDNSERFTFLSNVYVVISILFFLGYILARLFMIVETFRTLFFLPPSAYIATWASNVPHIA